MSAPTPNNWQQLIENVKRTYSKEEALAACNVAVKRSSMKGMLETQKRKQK